MTVKQMKYLDKFQIRMSTVGGSIIEGIRVNMGIT